MPKVLYEKRGEIAYITLNRPDKRNAIDTETDDLLFDAWTRFREDDEVRLEALVLEAVHLAGAPETHLDLIDDDQDAMAPAALLDGREEPRRRHDDAAVGHDRLDENGRDLLRRRSRGEMVVEEFEHGLRAEGRTIGIRIGQKQ